LGRRSATFLVAGLMATASYSTSLASVGATTAKLLWPAAGRIIVNTCGDPRAARDGLNLALPPGAEIHSIDRGVVAYAGNELKRYGNMILIRHPDGWVSAYAHLGRMRVKRNDRVKRGQTIATAPGADFDDPLPFHFELRQKSEWVDPRPYLVGGVARTSASGCAG
jgi:murein DD-endopeptidase MepM/ murein hydrolase activator NlpD